MGTNGRKRLRSKELEWLAEQRQWLEDEFAGQYLAVSGSSLLAHGIDPVAVHQEAVNQGHPRALIHRVLPKEFQGMKFVR